LLTDVELAELYSLFSSNEVVFNYVTSRLKEREIFFKKEAKGDKYAEYCYLLSIVNPDEFLSFNEQNKNTRFMNPYAKDIFYCNAIERSFNSNIHLYPSEKRNDN